jgi:hypothetical protein
MRRAALVLFVAFVVSGLCWFPMQMSPNFGWPIWLPPALICLAAFTGSVLLPSRRWLVPVASSLGALSAAGLGFRIWWPDDPIAVPWVPVVLTAVPFGAALFAAAGAVLGYAWAPKSIRYPSVNIGILGGIGILCSTAIAANGPLINQKIRYNRPIAEERVKALYQGAIVAIKESGEETSAQDNKAVRKFYRGPRFTDSEWDGMTRNFMRENGFVYQIHIEPPPGQGVLVYALPIEYEDRVGLGFCLDDTGRMECPLNLDPARNCSPEGPRVRCWSQFGAFWRDPTLT